MRALFLAGLVALALWQPGVHAQVPGLPIVDFTRYFPHMVAVSEEVKNAQWPRGVQWKLVSVSDEQEKLVTVALIRREGRERIVRVLLAKGPAGKAEEGFRSLVTEAAEDYGVRFETADLRDVRTFETLKRRAEGSGWGMTALPNSVQPR
jgi:hypothetical protein